MFKGANKKYKPKPTRMDYKIQHNKVLAHFLCTFLPKTKAIADEEPRSEGEDDNPFGEEAGGQTTEVTGAWDRL